jgi:hypothetical protein
MFIFLQLSVMVSGAVMLMLLPVVSRWISFPDLAVMMLSPSVKITLCPLLVMMDFIWAYEPPPSPTYT